MFKSCNSDLLEFVCLTNENIQVYLETVSSKVEEITFWNYQMCLHPHQLHYKEILFIPSLERFSHLRCVKFYNERIDVEVTRFPPSVERVFFISCIVKNQWLNVCVYRKNLKHLDQYYSSVDGIKHVLGFLQQPSTTPPTETARQSPPSLVRRFSSRRQRSLSLWNRMKKTFYGSFFSLFAFSWKKKVCPEMSEFVPLYQPNIEMTILRPSLNICETKVSERHYTEHSPIHTLHSIRRLKKSYDLLVNENIIQFLIGD
jgi:hypothetical protein